jgi:hypothetical protein
MRKFLVPLGILGVFLGLVRLLWPAGAPPFSEFSSKEGKFAILMPGTPEKKTKFVNGVTQITYGTSFNNCVYSVSYADMPTFDAFNLNNSAKNVVKAFAGKVLTDTPCSFAYSKGRQFEARTTKPKGFLSCRITIINLRYYMILAVGEDARLSNANVEKFLHSFKRLQ